MHAPDCHCRFEVGDYALELRRPVADAGRWAALHRRANIVELLLTTLRHQQAKRLSLMVIVILLTACSMAYDPKATMYVVFEPGVNDRFLSDLSEVAKANKLDPWSDSLVTGSGRTDHVFEATGRALRV